MSEQQTGEVFRRVNRGRNHYYEDGAGNRLPGVTTILGDGLPKPALTTWAARTAAEYAVDRWDDLAEQPLSKRLALIKGAPWEQRDAAALRGTQLHGIAEKLAAGESVDFPDTQAGHVEALVRFLDDWDVQPVLAERPIANLKVRYGGTFDVIADLKDGKRWLLDFKTGKGVYGEVAFQLAAYRYAEVYLDDERAAQPMIDVEACGVVHVRADGYDLYPIVADERVFMQFRYIAECAKAAKTSRDYVGAAVQA